MAGGAVHGPPYQGAVAVVQWALDWWPYVDGHFIGRGVDLRTLPMDRMLNAIQNRMVEESLVTKEVYDAMLRMRNRINGLFGMASPAEDMDDWMPMPQTASGPVERPKTAYRPSPNQVPAAVLATADASRKRSVPANQPVKPYIPPTLPREDGNPFPGLAGPMG